MLSFPETRDIHGDDFIHFMVCNCAPSTWACKPDFYKLKDAMLKRYAKRDGYDLQIVEKTCWDCGGSGKDFDYDRLCDRCDMGVYHRSHIALRRYVLNGMLFHCPRGRVSLGGRLEGVELDFHDIIRGLIKHTPVQGWDANKSYNHLITIYGVLCPLLKPAQTGHVTKQPQL